MRAFGAGDRAPRFILGAGSAGGAGGIRGSGARGDRGGAGAAEGALSKTGAGETRGKLNRVAYPLLLITRINPLFRNLSNTV